MAISNEDGLVIPTEIDTTGFRRGYAEIQQAMASLTQSVERNGQSIGAAFTESMSGAGRTVQSLDALLAKQKEMQEDQSTQDKLKQWDELQDKIEETAKRGREVADALNGKATAEYPEPPKRGTAEYEALRAEYLDIAKSMRALRDEEEHMRRTDVGQAVRDWEELTAQIAAARQEAEDITEIPAPTPGNASGGETRSAGPAIPARAEEEEEFIDLETATDRVKELTREYNRLTTAITSAEMKLEGLKAQQDTLSAHGIEEQAEQWDDLQRRITAYQNVLQTARLALWETTSKRETLEKSPIAPQKGEDFTAASARRKAEIAELTRQEEAYAKSVENTERKIQELREDEKALKGDGAQRAAAQWEKLQMQIEQTETRLAAMRSAREETGGALEIAREQEEILRAAEEAEEASTQKSTGSAWRDSIIQWQEAQGVLGHLRLIINEVGSGLARMTAALGRVAWRGVQRGARLAANGVRSLTSRLREMRNHTNLAQQTAQTLTKSLLRIKTMLISRIKRTFISYLFKNLTSSVKALAKFDKDFDTAFSNLRNRTSELGSNLVVSFGSLIKAVEPFLTMVLSAASKAVTAINALIASISGAKTATRAVKQTKSYAESLEDSSESADKAAKSQKKLNAELTSYDELHKLSGADDGDDDKSADDGSNIYEAVDPEAVFAGLPAGAQKAIDRIKEAFKKGNWAEIGKAIADGLNDAVQWLDGQIDPIAAKASLAAAKLAQGISAAFAEFNGYELGAMLAHGINAATTVAYNFLRNLRFKEIGQTISDGIEGLFLNIDYQGIGQVLAMHLNGIITVIYTVLTETDWYGIAREFANGLNTLVNGVDWAKLGATIGAAINTLTQLVWGLVANFDWAGAASRLAAAINGLFSTVDWNAVGHTLGESIKGILTFITKALEETDWHQIGLSIATFLRGVDWSGITRALGELLGAAIGAVAGLLWGAIQGVVEDIQNFFLEEVESMDTGNIGLDIALGILKGIGDAFINIGKWIYDNVLTPIADGIKSVFGIASPSTVMAEYGGYMASGLLEGISAGWTAIVETVQKLADAIAGVLSAAWNGIKSAAKTAWGGIKSTVSNALGTVKDKAAEIAGDVRDKLSESWENVKNAASEKWTAAKDAITGAMNTAKSKASEIAGAIKTAVSSKWDEIKNAAASKWSDIKSAVTRSQTETRDALQGTDYARVGDSMVGGIKSGASKAWGAMQTAVVGLYGKLREAFQNTDLTRVGSGFVSGIKSGLSSAWSGLKSKTIGLWGDLRFDLQNTDFTRVGRDLVSGLANGIWDSWDNVTNTIWNGCGAIYDSVCEFFGIASPSRLFYEVGEYLTAGLDEGLADSAGEVLDTTSALAQDITERMQEARPEVSIYANTDALEAVSGLAESISARMEPITAEIDVQTAGGALEAVRGLAEGISARLGTITAEVDLNATEGLLSGLDAVSNRLSGIAASFRAIAEQLPDFQRIGEPQIATGSVVPVKTKIAETQDNSGELHGIRGLLEQLLEALQDNGSAQRSEKIELVCDGRTLAEAVRRYDVRSGRIMNGGAR